MVVKVEIQWNTTIFGLFWVNHEEPLLSWMHERPERERQPRVPRALRDRIDFEMILKFRAISPKSLASAAVMLLPYQLLLLESPYSEWFEQPVLIHLSMIRLDEVKSGALQSKSELTRNGYNFDDSDFPAFLTGVNMVSPVNRALSPHRLLLNQYYYLVSVGVRTWMK